MCVCAHSFVRSWLPTKKKACDGVWDVATNEQCSSFIQSLIDDGENDLGLICEEVLDTCLDRNSRDNMTIAVVTFEALLKTKTSQQRPRSGLGTIGISNTAVWQRRAARRAKQLQQSAKDVATRAASNVGLLVVPSSVDDGNNNNATTTTTTTNSTATTTTTTSKSSSIKRSQSVVAVPVAGS